MFRSVKPFLCRVFGHHGVKSHHPDVFLQCMRCENAHIPYQWEKLANWPGPLSAAERKDLLTWLPGLTP